MKPSPLADVPQADQRLNRRSFLTWGALATGITLIPGLAAAKRSMFQPIIPPPDRSFFAPPVPMRTPFYSPADPPEKSVSLYNTHTGEAVNAVYWVEGEYLPEALAAVDHVLRDHRTDEIKSIDPLLLDLLHAIREELGCRQAFHIISGYRSPTTNAYLRAMSRAVAEHSLHMDGKAVDLRLPGWAAFTVRSVARDLRVGGVGYYARSEFVHIDVGPIRYW